VSICLQSIRVYTPHALYGGVRLLEQELRVADTVAVYEVVVVVVVTVVVVELVTKKNLLPFSTFVSGFASLSSRRSTSCSVSSRCITSDAVFIAGSASRSTLWRTSSGAVFIIGSEAAYKSTLLLVAALFLFLPYGIHPLPCTILIAHSVKVEVVTVEVEVVVVVLFTVVNTSLSLSASS